MVEFILLVKSSMEEHEKDELLKKYRFMAISNGYGSDFSFRIKEYDDNFDYETQLFRSLKSEN